ncbi:MAG: aromatic amino acid transport family protein [bacterium]|nr:aromatic amino acid transport family protein [bacterium]
MKIDKFVYSVATLTTTVVGIGIFGIPFSFVKAGFLTGFLFLVGVFIVTLLSNLMYGEIVLRTKRRYQIVGYVGKYLGRNSRKLVLFSFMLVIYGALLAITVVSGTFWSHVFFFVNISPTAFSFIFFGLASAVVLKGLRTASKVDFVLLSFFIAVIILMALFSFSRIEVANYLTLFQKEFWFLPFGVIMFSFAGVSSVVLVREILNNDEKRFKKAIIAGTVIPGVIYVVLTLVVVGVSGELTSPDAISGLGIFLNPRILFLGSLLGFLSTFTVFINYATALRESFQYDFGIRKFHAQLLVLVPPILLFISGLRNFIEIIGLVGAIGISIDIIIIVFAFMAARKKGDREPEYSLKIPHWLLYLLVAIFAVGAVYALIFF